MQVRIANFLIGGFYGQQPSTTLTFFQNAEFEGERSFLVHVRSVTEPYYLDYKAYAGAERTIKGHLTFNGGQIGAFDSVHPNHVTSPKMEAGKSYKVGIVLEGTQKMASFYMWCHGIEASFDPIS